MVCQNNLLLQVVRCPVRPSSSVINGTNEFSELVLAEMVLLIDQSRSVLSLRSAKAREFQLESCGRSKCTPRFGPFRLNWLEPVLFEWPERTNEEPAGSI